MSKRTEQARTRTDGATPPSDRQCAAVFEDIATRSKAIAYLSRLAFDFCPHPNELECVTNAIESLAKHNALMADHLCTRLGLASVAGGDVEYWLMPPAFAHLGNDGV